ncbi:hypothetical protein HYX10_03575 [Candidatus Woesearchaeota archaeon]|nr:hypothetical protein [Candidatus Woesearchaeota archaeon]
MADILGWGSGTLIVIAVRLLVPLTIFWKPLPGAILSVLADTFDVVLLTLIGRGFFPDYTKFDKALDWYFMLFMMVKSWQWEPLAKWTAAALFGWRTAGVALIEATGTRQLLFVFPNLFILWWFFNQIRMQYAPNFKLTPKRVIAALLILLIPKLAQEYYLHIFQAQPWTWIQEHILRIK